MRLDRDGAEIAFGILADQLNSLTALADSLPEDRAGVRLNGYGGLQPFAGPAATVTQLVSRRLGRTAFAVRALMFDKTATTNWALAWHQDRTIVVRDRCSVPGFDIWTRKAGLLHVAPPPDVLARMVTVRIHLDRVSPANAPLLIAPGSHRLGRIAEPDIPAIVARCGTYACLAEPGDVWLYATPILHASDAARKPERRRVLQIDYAADPLPGGLEWLGV